MGGGQGSGRSEGTKSGETRQEKAGTECCGQGRYRCGLEKALGGKEGGCEEIACELECIAAVNPRGHRQNSEFGLPGHARGHHSPKSGISQRRRSKKRPVAAALC